MDFMDIYKDILYNKFESILKQARKKIAMMSIERQYKAYCNFARHKSWNREKEYRGILDECWRCILEDISLEESIWDMHEGIRPENIQKSAKEEIEIESTYADIFSCNVAELIDHLIDDLENEEGFLLLNIGYIISYLNEDSVEGKFEIDKYKNHILIKNEIKNQQADLEENNSIIDYMSIQKWINKSRSLLEE